MGEVNKKKAEDIAVKYLKPIVSLLKSAHPDAIISMLMAEKMQAILVPVAIKLGIQGIRVGLEDGLNVIDISVPGGIRKAIDTADQVRQVRQELQQKGFNVLSVEKLRDKINIQSPETVFFRNVAKALEPYTAYLTDFSMISDTNVILEKLAPFIVEYSEKEDNFISDVLQGVHTNNLAPEKLADFIWDTARHHGIFIRFFIEEADRYDDSKKFSIRDIHIIQPLNFMRELLSERGMDFSIFEEALRAYKSNKSSTKIIPKSQFKNLETRFLEYVFGLSSQYNLDRTDVIHTVIRNDKNYSTTMAIVYHMLKCHMLELRSRSSSVEEKNHGVRWSKISSNSAKEICITDTNSDYSQSFAKNQNWICLPSTPTTNYRTGIKLSYGLFKTLYNFVSQSLVDYSNDNSDLEVLGITHTGKLDNDEDIIEATMLVHRFANNICELKDLSNYSSNIIYDRIVLPRVVGDPQNLSYQLNGLVNRDNDGWLLNKNGSKAAPISNNKIQSLELLKFLGHSSGIATMQSIDNYLCKDMDRFHFSLEEQKAIFRHFVLVHFGSASNPREDKIGTSIIDLTAGNDIRSIAGTTIVDYMNILPSKRKMFAKKIAMSESMNNDDATIIKISTKSKTIIRYQNVLLSPDPARLQDGHSIKRYTEEAPEHLRAMIALLDCCKEFSDSSNMIARASLMVQNRFKIINSKRGKI